MKYLKTEHFFKVDLTPGVEVDCFNPLCFVLIGLEKNSNCNFS